MVRKKMRIVMRSCLQGNVNQEKSEQNEVDRTKKRADSTGKVMHRSSWRYVMTKMQMVTN